MNSLLALPEVQSGVVPFVAALVIALALRPSGWVWSGLALTAGFYASAYIVESGFSFSPLTSTRKLLLAGLVATGMGLLADLLPGRRRHYLIVAFGVLAGGVGLWLVEPLLSRQQGPAFWLLAAGAFLYPAWHAAWSEVLRADAVRAATAGWVLGLATAACVILGASARLGQLSIGLGVAAGAFWLVVVFAGGLRSGSLLALPAAVLGSLLGLSGATYAQTPWYSLAPLALVPVLAGVPLPSRWPHWAQGILLAAITVPAGALAVLLAWQLSAGGDAGYGY